MPAILAKKLGMTQRFLEDGRVERVTVLEAGPCPVTAVRSEDADGYEAMQLAFGSVREKHLTKPELGHLRKASAPPRFIPCSRRPCASKAIESSGSSGSKAWRSCSPATGIGS